MDHLNTAAETLAYARELRTLYRAAEQRAVRFRLLVEMGRDLVNIRDTDTLLRMALVRVTTFSGYDTGAILLKDTNGGLEVRAALNMQAPQEAFTLPAQVFEQALNALRQSRMIQVPMLHLSPQSAAIYLPLIPSDGKPLGVVLLVGMVPGGGPEIDDLDALQLLSAQLAAALQSTQMHEEKDQLLHRLVEREHQLAELVDQLIGAQEEERRRVAYELHDGLAQMTIGVLQQIHVLADRYHPRAPRARDALRRAVTMGQATVNEARRVIAGLRPTVLDDFGLAKALETQIKELQLDGWDVIYDESLNEARIAPAVETALFRIAQEGLNNIRKHAGTTQVVVRLKPTGSQIQLIIEDQGRGFDPCIRLAAEPGKHIGLASIQERVRLFDGQWHLESQIGTGTRLEVTLPLLPAQQGA